MNTAIIVHGARAMAPEIQRWYDHADRADQIIFQHSCVAGAAGLIPAPAVDSAICLGNQIALYARLNTLMGISIASQTLKVVGGFMVSQVTGMLSIFGFAIAAKGIGLLCKCFPGLGTVGGIVIDCGTNAGIAYVLGVVYMKAMVNLFKAGKPVTEASLKEAIRAEFADKDGIKAIYREGKRRMKDVKFSDFTAQAEAMRNA